MIDHESRLFLAELLADLRLIRAELAVIRAEHEAIRLEQEELWQVVQVLAADLTYQTFGDDVLIEFVSATSSECAP